MKMFLYSHIMTDLSDYAFVLNFDKRTKLDIYLKPTPHDY